MFYAWWMNDETNNNILVIGAGTNFMNLHFDEPDDDELAENIYDLIQNMNIGM